MGNCTTPVTLKKKTTLNEITNNEIMNYEIINTDRMNAERMNNEITNHRWPTCPLGTTCENFRRLKAYGTDENDLLHCKAYEHPVIPCRYRAQCRAFVRFQQNSWSIADQCHLVCYSHTRANYLGTANLIGCNNLKIITPQDADPNQFQLVCHGYLPNERVDSAWYHFQNMEVSMQDLVGEVIANGYERVLELDKHPEGLTHLTQIAESKLSHPKNSPNQTYSTTYQMNEVDIMAVLLYTGTDVQGDFRWDMITHQTGSHPKWPMLYKSLGHAQFIRKRQNEQKYNVYHGLHGVAMTDMEAVVSQIRGGWWVAGFRLPTFFSTSLDIQQAINFAAGEAGTAEQSDQTGMIIEFKTGKWLGADIDWISKFYTEREVLIPPWHIAAPDMSRVADLDYITKGQDPEEIGNFQGLKNFSVYSSEKEARQAIENATTFKEVVSTSGRIFTVQYLTLLLSDDNV